MAKQKQENKQISKQTVKVNVNVISKKKKAKGRRKTKKNIQPPILLPQMPAISYGYSQGFNTQTASLVPSQPLKENPEPSSLNNVLGSGAGSALTNLAIAYANKQNIGTVDSSRSRGRNSRNRSMSVGDNANGGGQNITTEEEKQFAQVSQFVS
jgi:hypothetical protein